VVNAFIGEHSPFILLLETASLKRILSSRTTFRTLQSVAKLLFRHLIRPLSCSLSIIKPMPFCYLPVDFRFTGS
jgi:hypothetical protein